MLGRSCLSFSVLLVIGSASASEPRCRQPEERNSAVQDVQHGSQLLRDLIDAQRRREEVARLGVVTFVECSRHGDDDPPIRVSCGELRQRGQFQKWTRWAVSGEKAGTILQDKDLGGACLAVRAVARPTISMDDGSRTVNVEPDARDSRLWRGQIKLESDPRIRRGGLHCGLMFAEQWLSDFLVSLELDSVIVEAQAITFLLKPKGEPQNRILVVAKTNGLTPLEVRWTKGETPVFESKAHTFVTLDGVELVQSGTIIANYKSRVRTDVMISYSAGTLTDSECSILRAPTEIASVNGAMVLVEESTRARVVMGNRSIVETEDAAHEHSEASGGSYARADVRRLQEDVGNDQQHKYTTLWSIGGTILAVMVVAMMVLSKRKRHAVAHRSGYRRGGD